LTHAPHPIGGWMRDCKKKSNPVFVLNYTNLILLGSKF
jgi:hypothetical protein